MPQLAQRFGLNLTDALARDRKNLADFLQGVLAAVIQAKSHPDDAFSSNSLLYCKPTYTRDFTTAPWGSIHLSL